MTNSERVIYEALIKIIVGKEARFEMEMAGINKGDELTHFRNSPEVSAFYVAFNFCAKTGIGVVYFNRKEGDPLPWKQKGGTVKKGRSVSLLSI